VSDERIENFKNVQRAIWTAGDYHAVSRQIQEVADLLVDRAEAGAGLSLLDVATGTGNVAVPAASRGAAVTALDLTPALLERARLRAQDEGVEIAFIEGDAESLPFADRSFDRVTSCFGVIFAPRQQLAASELARVARPGGSVLVTAWTPEGINGRMFKTIASYMPPPPPDALPSVAWGEEEHVRSLFASSGAELDFERRMVTFTHDSEDDWVQYSSTNLGPLVLARAALEPQRRWADLEAELLDMYRQANEADDGSLRVRAEYLLSTVRLPG
jgi:ubiquinone/menaquinone biosynthesis C-methylase UbiE